MDHKFQRVISSYLNFREFLAKKTLKEFQSSEVEDFKLETS